MWPAAQHDDGDLQIAAGLGDSGQPLRGGRAGSGGHHHRDGLRAAAVGGAGPADDYGFGLIEDGVQCGWYQDAVSGRLAGGAGQEPGGVGGGEDDLGWRPAGDAGRPGQQAGQDGPGGVGRAEAGQAEAAEGGRVGGDLLAVADADRDRAGQDRAGVLPAGRGTGGEPGRGGGSGLGEAGEGRLVWPVQVQVEVRAGVLWGCASRGGAGGTVQGGDDRAGGAAGWRLEVRTVPGR